MKIHVKSKRTDVSYFAEFKEPVFGLLENHELRGSIIKQLLKSYRMRLNDFRMNNDQPSDKLLMFKKFDDPSFFEVVFGIDQVTADLKTVRDRIQKKYLYESLAPLLKLGTIKSQRVIIDRQLSTKDNAKAYLQSLSPYCPAPFEGILQSQGAQYVLQEPDSKATIRILITESLFIPEGLYLYINISFPENMYGYQEALDKFEEIDTFAVNALEIEIEESA